jgi:hypothetical protein
MPPQPTSPTFSFVATRVPFGKEPSAEKKIRRVGIFANRGPAHKTLHAPKVLLSFRNNLLMINLRFHVPTGVPGMDRATFARRGAARVIIR